MHVAAEQNAKQVMAAMCQDFRASTYSTKNQNLIVPISTPAAGTNSISDSVSGTSGQFPGHHDGRIPESIDVQFPEKTIPAYNNPSSSSGTWDPSMVSFNFDPDVINAYSTVTYDIFQPTPNGVTAVPGYLLRRSVTAPNGGGTTGKANGSVHDAPGTIRFSSSRRPVWRLRLQPEATMGREQLHSVYIQVQTSELNGSTASAAGPYKQVTTGQSALIGTGGSYAY